MVRNITGGKTTVSGMWVSCYDTLSSCNEACHFSCYEDIYCNDSPAAIVACAPGVRTMIILSILFVLLVGLCCVACCCLCPFCTCAIWYRKRRQARARRTAQASEPVPMYSQSQPAHAIPPPPYSVATSSASAPPLLDKRLLQDA